MDRSEQINIHPAKATPGKTMCFNEFEDLIVIGLLKR